MWCYVRRLIVEKKLIPEETTVLVIGTQRPVIEGMLIALNVKKVWTLDYARLHFEHPASVTILPEDFRKLYISGRLPKFDLIVSDSSLEHSGLGRYGDALNPWGDLI